MDSFDIVANIFIEETRQPAHLRFFLSLRQQEGLKEKGLGVKRCQRVYSKTVKSEDSVCLNQYAE